MKFTTASGNSGITQDNKVATDRENYSVQDYIELLWFTSENHNLYKLITQEMKEIISDWDWETVIDNGEDIMKVWEERDWFETQVVCALDDGNLFSFGDY